jgi:ubiquinol-cytochrome c reductase cytochrome c subunit
VTRVLGIGAALSLLVAVSLLLFSPPPGFGQDSTDTSSGATPDQIAAGRQLFVDGCSSCHGYEANGVEGVAPSLHGVGAQASDFYLRTGRMPLSSPDQQPVRGPPAYSPDEIAELNAYIGSLGGPPVPDVSLDGTDLSAGQQLFADRCSGCHQIAARGGIVTGATVPALTESTPQQILEAVRIGPYLMPRFGENDLTDEQVADIARYITYARQPTDRGGWGIGHIGPVPEGMVTWLLAVPVLLLLTRLIGERTER